MALCQEISLRGFFLYKKEEEDGKPGSQKEWTGHAVQDLLITVQDKPERWTFSATAPLQLFPLTTSLCGPAQPFVRWHQPKHE